MSNLDAYTRADIEALEAEIERLRVFLDDGSRFCEQDGSSPQCRAWAKRMREEGVARKTKCTCDLIGSNYSNDPNCAVHNKGFFNSMVEENKRLKDEIISINNYDFKNKLSHLGHLLCGDDVKLYATVLYRVEYLLRLEKIVSEAAKTAKEKGILNAPKSASS